MSQDSDISRATGCLEQAPPGSPDGTHPSEDVTPPHDEHEEAPRRTSGGSRRRPRDPALARAFRTGRPVTGKVEKAIKGGFEVRVGKSRAFCPYSQMDLHRVEQPDEHLGRSYIFNILQFRRGGEDVVLSRRAILEEERREEAKAVRATLLEGAVMWGRVASVADFGAFIDLGAGVTGLVHISELAHDRTEQVGEAVKPGDWVHVRILKLDDARGRISLSMRQAQEDPWRGFAERFQVGGVYPGTVSRLTDFGAFVELCPGVEVLAHARDFPPSPGDWRDGLDIGQEHRWLLLAMDPARRRATVVPAPADGSVITEIREGTTLPGRVQRVEKFGVFVWLAPGKVGLIPASWTGTSRGGDLARAFPAGRRIEVDVVEVADDGRRIRLAVKGSFPEPAARRTARKPAARPDAKPRKEAPQPEASGTFGTSLGDALRAALDRGAD